MNINFCPKCGKMLSKQDNILKCSFCNYSRNLDKFHIDNLEMPIIEKCIIAENKKEFINAVINKNKEFDELKIMENSDEIINKANNDFIKNNEQNIFNKFRHELNSYSKCLDESDIEIFKDKYNMDCYNFFDKLNFKEKIDKFNNKFIENILNDFNEFLDSREKYIDDAEIESLKIKYNKICCNIFDKLKIKEKIDKFNITYCDAHEDRIKEKLPNRYISNSDKIDFSYLNGFKCDLTKIVNYHNEEYIENQIKNNKHFYNSLLDKNLSDDVIRAILIEDDVKIIVNDQDKTFVEAKIKYLIEKLNISPTDILYISANEKNYDKFDINKNFSIKTHTFNSLACEILKENYYYKKINKDEFEVFIKSFFEKQVTKNPESMRDVVKFFLYFYHMAFFNESNINFQTIRSIVGDWDEEFEKNYLEYFEINDIEVKKEYVNSIMELVIANFLYIHNISYNFNLNPLLESRENWFNYIEHNENDAPEIFRLDMKMILNEIDPEYIYDKSGCYSNFYLPEYDIYIDLLSLNNYFQKNSINSGNKTSYLEEIKNFNEKSKTKIITISSDIKDVVSMLESLEENLKKYGVNIEKVDYSELYGSIILNNKLPEYEFFLNTMEQFIKSFKDNAVYLDNNKKDIAELTIEQYLKENDKIYFKSLNLRNKFFFNVFKQIYREYKFKLKKEELFDNYDIINYAIIDLKKGENIHNYKYIIVDEYQSMSYSKFNLLKEIQNKSGAKIIAMGDDFQPSSSFPICNVDLFINFEKYFKHSKTVKIKNANSNSQQVNSLIENFNQNDEKQLESNDEASNNLIKLVGYMSRAEQILSLINVLEKIDEVDENADILILGRNSDDINEILCENLLTKYEKDNYIKIIYKKLPNLKIEYKPILESKNLKKDHIIVLNLCDELNGFPNKIESDLVLNFITNNNENVTYSEERKLLCLALTRAKNEAYLFYNEINPSIFIGEIKDFSVVEKLNFTFSNEEIHKMYSMLNEASDIIKTNNICPDCNSGNVDLVIVNKNKSFKLKCSKFCGWNVEQLKFKECSILCKRDMDRMGMPQFNTYYLHKYVKRDWRKGEYKGNPIDVEVSEKIMDYKYKNKNYAIQLFTEELMNAITYLSYYKMNNNIKKIALLVVPSGAEIDLDDEYMDFEGYRLARSVKLIHQWYELGISKSLFGLNKKIIDLKHSFIRIETIGSSKNHRDNPMAHTQSIKCNNIPEHNEDIAFIILDDITTSGSSMVGCKQVLLDNGIDEDNIFTLTIGATVRNRYGKI